MAKNPYTKLPASAYWRTGVARHSGKGKPLEGLWTPGAGIAATDRFLTVGSCFAQHIGRALDQAGLDRMIVEKAPPMLDEAEQREFGYGLFSFRIGNVYTTAMLLQWLRWVQDPTSEDQEVWEDDGAFYDPVRPGIEPGGFETLEELRDARRATIAAMRRGIESADVLVFTLGLTEGWENAATGLVYASCPGTQAGSFDPDRHVFRNAGITRIASELDRIRTILRDLNPGLRMLLTVSPVPLVATAQPGRHVLVSTVHSKSVLRAVAGEMAAAHEDVDYFPSYELVSHPALGLDMFEADRREVSKPAVGFVMRHFLAGLGVDAQAVAPARSDATPIDERIDAALAEGDAICDEVELERHNENED